MANKETQYEESSSILLSSSACSNFYQAMMNVFPIGIAIIDEKMEIQYYNKMCAKMMHSKCKNEMLLNIVNLKNIKSNDPSLDHSNKRKQDQQVSIANHINTLLQIISDEEDQEQSNNQKSVNISNLLVHSGNSIKFSKIHSYDRECLFQLSKFTLSERIIRHGNGEDKSVRVYIS